MNPNNMERKFAQLYNAISDEKRALNENLSKVDAYVVNSITACDRVSPKSLKGAQYDVALRLLKVLRKLIDVNFALETLTDEDVQEDSELHQNNPFRQNGSDWSTVSDEVSETTSYGKTYGERECQDSNVFAPGTTADISTKAEKPCSSQRYNNDVMVTKESPEMESPQDGASKRAESSTPNLDVLKGIEELKVERDVQETRQVSVDLYQITRQFFEKHDSFAGKSISPEPEIQKAPCNQSQKQIKLEINELNHVAEVPVEHFEEVVQESMKTNDDQPKDKFEQGGIVQEPRKVDDSVPSNRPPPLPVKDYNAADKHVNCKEEPPKVDDNLPRKPRDNTASKHLNQVPQLPKQVLDPAAGPPIKKDANNKPPTPPPRVRLQQDLNLTAEKEEKQSVNTESQQTAKMEQRNPGVGAEKEEESPMNNKGQQEADACKDNFSAVDKLKNAHFRNRREEAVEQYRNVKYLPETFTLTEVPATNLLQPKTNEKKKKDLPSEPLYELRDDTLRVNMVCTFSHIVSPSEFYLHNNSTLVKNLSSAMNDELNKLNFCVQTNYTSKEAARNFVGDYCYAFIPSKSSYYRVSILDWLLLDGCDSDMVYCQLVDHGEKLHCSYKNLKKMNNPFALVPKLAIRCHFAELRPTRISFLTGPNQWPKPAVDVLKELTWVKGGNKKFVVIYAHKEKNSFAIDLFEEGSKAEQTLAELLIQKGLAHQADGAGGVTSLESILENDLTEYDNINEAVTGYDARDEARICPFTNAKGTCYKGPKCKLEHSRLSADGITTDKELSSNKAFTNLNLPPVGEWVDVVITGFVNTCHFYVQFIKQQEPGSIFMGCVADEKFQNLLDAMNAKNYVMTYEPFKTLPGVGEVVLVMHNCGQWFRATFQHLGEDPNTVELFLVDFGFKHTTDMKNVRHIKDEFLHLPFQAVECMLDKYREKPDVDKVSACNFFWENFNFKQFQAVITASNLPLPLQVIDSKGLDMGNILKQFGFAEERKTDLNPSPECILQISS